MMAASNGCAEERKDLTDTEKTMEGTTPGPVDWKEQCARAKDKIKEKPLAAGNTNRAP